MRATLVLVLLAACENMDYCPEPKAEDVRLCAPARDYGFCMRRLGYTYQELPCKEPKR
jgi:hypothetical protein